MNFISKALFITTALVSPFFAKGQTQKPVQTPQGQTAPVKNAPKKSVLSAEGVSKPNFDTGSKSTSTADISFELETDKTGKIKGTMTMVDYAQGFEDPNHIVTLVEGRQDRDEENRKRITLKTVDIDSEKSNVRHASANRAIPYDAVVTVIETAQDYYEGDIRYVSDKAFTTNYKGEFVKDRRASRYNPLLEASIPVAMTKSAKAEPLPAAVKYTPDTTKYGIKLDRIAKAKQDARIKFVKDSLAHVKTTKDSLAAVKAKQDSIAKAQKQKPATASTAQTKPQTAQTKPQVVTTAPQKKDSVVAAAAVNKQDIVNAAAKDPNQFLYVNYHLGSSTEMRSKEDYEYIQAIGKEMQRNPKLQLITVGYSDKGEAKGLDKDRAHNVADILKDQFKISKKRIIAITPKIEDPASSNDVAGDASRVRLAFAYDY